MKSSRESDPTRSFRFPDSMTLCIFVFYAFFVSAPQASFPAGQTQRPQSPQRPQRLGNPRVRPRLLCAPLCSMRSLCQRRRHLSLRGKHKVHKVHKDHKGVRIPVSVPSLSVPLCVLCCLCVSAAGTQPCGANTKNAKSTESTKAWESQRPSPPLCAPLRSMRSLCQRRRHPALRGKRKVHREHKVSWPRVSGWIGGRAAVFVPIWTRCSDVRHAEIIRTCIPFFNRCVTITRTWEAHFTLRIDPW